MNMHQRGEVAPSSSILGFWVALGIGSLLADCNWRFQGKMLALVLDTHVGKHGAGAIRPGEFLTVFVGHVKDQYSYRIPQVLGGKI